MSTVQVDAEAVRAGPGRVLALLRHPVLVLGGLAALMVLLPQVGLGLMAAHLVLLAALLALRFDALRQARGDAQRADERRPDAQAAAREQARASRDEARPFVSIHVPTCDEPPRVVQRTLEALERVRWPALEVIVLDNNTRDPALWTPIERWCEGRARFRFFHVDRLEGAKAGALNLCLARADPRAALIGVVDADYQAGPQIVTRALAQLAEAEQARGGPVSHVQFPQAYLDGGVDSRGVETDYARYFDLFMPAAEVSDGVLLTGTLLFIRREALEAVGRWRDASITEDAELGLRLWLGGHRGRYAPEVVGLGMMPSDLRSAHKQRRRWVHGNAQALGALLADRRGWGAALSGGGRGVLAQLTAWFNLLLAPTLALLIVAVMSALGVAGAAHRGLATVAGAAALLELGALGVLFAASPARVARGFVRARWRGLIAHGALAWEGATGWVEALLGARLGFERTDKFARVGAAGGVARHLIGAALLGVAACALLGAGLLVAGVAAALLALILLCPLVLRRELGAIAARDHALLGEACGASAPLPALDPARGVTSALDVSPPVRMHIADAYNRAGAPDGAERGARRGRGERRDARAAHDGGDRRETHALHDAHDARRAAARRARAAHAAPDHPLDGGLH